MRRESIQESSLPEAERTLRRKRRRGLWKAAVSMMSCLVLLFTTCAMIQPASAADSESYCGHEEHRHGEACYEKKLICEHAGKESGHTHGPECYSEQKTLTCGEQEREDSIHTHGESCRTQQRELICTQQEREAGTHTHGAQCYTEQRKLICAQEENTAVHTHTEGCIAREQVLICADENAEHVHTEGCYQTTESIVCGLAEGAALGHVHTDGCYGTEKVLSCTLPEGETIPGHAHTDACYSTKETLSCGHEEGETIPGHAHTDACYGTEKVLSCTIPEETTGTGAGTEQTPADGAQGGTENRGHTHADECYQKTLKCKREEHTHKLSCFSNPGADLESAGVWERSLAGVELSGEWRKDLLAIAQTQLGYTESSRNYAVAKDGTKKGYSRYGAWYGIEYGDWCAMFISFCLHYAQIPEESFPPEAVCDNWIETLQSEKYKLYHKRGEYTPHVGDVVFFDWETDGESDHVGIVAELRQDEKGALTGIKTIEGNAGNRVGYAEYVIEDERIMGYAVLPENPRVEYRWSRDGLEVTVSVLRSEELPENAKLVVQRMNPQDDGYANKLAAAQKTLAADEPTEATQLELFRVYLEADGKEILADKEAWVKFRLLEEEPKPEEPDNTQGAGAPTPGKREQAEAGSESNEAALIAENSEKAEAPAQETGEGAGKKAAKPADYTAQGAQMRTPKVSAQNDELSGSFEAKLSGEYAIAMAQNVTLMKIETRAVAERMESVCSAKKIDISRDGTDGTGTESGGDTGADKTDLPRQAPDETQKPDARKSEEGENCRAHMTYTAHAVDEHGMLAQGYRVENMENAQSVDIAADATQIEPVIVAPLIAAPLLLALLIARCTGKNDADIEG